VDALLTEEPREDQVVRHQRGDGARQLLSLEGIVCHVFPSGKWRSPRRAAEGFVDEWGWSEPVGAQSARLGARIERPFSGRGEAAHQLICDGGVGVDELLQLLGVRL